MAQHHTIPGLSDQERAAFDTVVAMYEAQVLKPSDYAAASPAALSTFRHLLRKRLLDGKSLPTVDEVEGLAELALDVLHYTPGRPEVPYGLGQF